MASVSGIPQEANYFEELYRSANKTPILSVVTDEHRWAGASANTDFSQRLMRWKEEPVARLWRLKLETTKKATVMDVHCYLI